MTHRELKKYLCSIWPKLKKSLFGGDPIMCRDGEYPYIKDEIYTEIDRDVWRQIEALGIVYGEGFPDCDDFADIKLGLFKIGWWKMMCQGKIPMGTPPSYSVCDGYNPQKEMHDFNAWVSDRLSVSDYGQRCDPEKYSPLKVRF